MVSAMFLTYHMQVRNPLCNDGRLLHKSGLNIIQTLLRIGRIITSPSVMFAEIQLTES